LSKLVLKLKLK